MKKILMMVVMLVLICSSCFAEWVKCNSPWMFDSGSIRNIGQSYVELEVVVGKEDSKSNTPGEMKIGKVTFIPHGPNPYHFKCLEMYSMLPDGTIYWRDSRPKSFSDYNLAQAICQYAGVR